MKDALLLRFNLKPDDLPNTCPARKCTQKFSLTHADIYPLGATVTRRHDHVKRIIGRFAQKALGIASVVIEPPLGALEPEAQQMIKGNVSE